MSVMILLDALKPDYEYSISNNNIIAQMFSFRIRLIVSFT